MPPAGKGEPLTKEQVALIRAWIDQGVAWTGTNLPPALEMSAAPTVGGTSVQGDKSKFREIEGVKDGLVGGLENFSLLQRFGLDKKVALDGRVLAPDQDYRIHLAYDNADHGFVHAGWEQWRKYYDDSGGYYQPFSPPQFNLNQDLHQDIGRAWIDFGLTLPRWPTMVFGYEYQYKDGSKSMLEWGPVGGNPGVPGSSKNIYPSWRDLDEHVHIVKFDLNHDFLGWHLEDNARVEIYSQKTTDHQAYTFSVGPGPDSSVVTRQGATHIEGMNTFRLEKQVTTWWFFSGGYLYTRFDGDASFNQSTVDASGVPTTGNFWSSDSIILDRESHVFSLTSLFLPLHGLSFSVGFQSEWQRQEGTGQIHLDSGNPYLPDAYSLLPASVQSDLDTQRTMENAALRYTAIPFTVLFADTQVEQERISQFERDDTDPENPPAFLRDTDASNDRWWARAGFNSSPWRWLSFGAHYKRQVSDSDYNHNVDETYFGGVPAPNPGYSAFILNRKIDGDEVQARVVLRPSRWLKTTLTYQNVHSDFSTTTDPVPGGTEDESVQAGKYRAHVYGMNLAVTPVQRLLLSGSFTYSDTRTATPATPDSVVVPYEGHVYELSAAANYSLNAATDLRLGYSFTQSDYGQNNIAAGLPLGLDFTRHGLTAGISHRFSKLVAVNLRYNFYQYSEPSSGGFNDYTAHGVFATLSYKWQ